MGRNICCDHDSSKGVKNQLKNHIYNMHTRHEKLKCDLCDYEGTKKHLAIHTRRVHDSSIQELHYCNFCQFKTKRKARLKNHIDSIHLNMSKVAECDTCNKKIAADYSKQHIKRVHGTYESHECSVCGQIMKGNKRRLQKHINVVHNDNAEKYYCNLCPFETKTKLTLKLHKEALHLGKTYKCNLCTYQATQNFRLKLHKNSQHK